MSTQREMTLEEWCLKLPANHLVNRQLLEKDRRIAELENGIREHRDSFSKDMEEHDWTTEDEALWSLVKEDEDE